MKARRTAKERPKFRVFTLIVAALTIVAGGEGSKAETASPPTVPTGTLIAPTAPERLKIAFVYPGNISDGGWSFSHDLGRKALEKQFGDKVSISVSEAVPEGPDSERVFRELAAQGNKLIFGAAFGYMDPMLKVAKNSKGVKFEDATGYNSSENMRVYDSRTFEGAYLAGVLAGGMTKTGVLGIVGSVPNLEVLRKIDCFTLGAQSVNPKIKTKIVWVNKWFAPPAETKAALSLINEGVDVLMPITDSRTVLKTAESAGKYAFGWDSDMSAYGPHAHIASIIINWAPYYIKATRDVLDGTWKREETSWGVKEGAIDIAISDNVPTDLKERVNQVKRGLKDGNFVIWKGPIITNEGKEVLKSGEIADAQFLSSVNFYVKGVEGRVPHIEEMQGRVPRSDKL
ncbi:BMP family ABC transporter substrate-binding protein [Paraburkholderia sp.]|uniref:BMP family ABC transporter substrate-binding protein n=1 Tax=Paraburkholderia sp. TaxID=1926495 RepID=UPI003C49756C